MTETNLPTAPQGENFLTKLMHDTLETMTYTDEKEAAERIQKLRAKHPAATQDDLAEKVIRNKCMQAGAIGAVTASPTMLPGLGTVVALTFGTAVDMRMMYKLQGELVLELINIYSPGLPLENKRNVLMVVTGISIGANQWLSESGQGLAAKATQRLAGRFTGIAAEEAAGEAATGLFAKSVSLTLGVATVAGINMITTYTIGKRAQAYLKQGPEAMEDWTASLRTVTGVDERKLLTWLVETTRASWQSIRHHSHDWAEKLADASQSAQEVYVIQANKRGRQVLEAGNYLAEHGNNGFARLVDLSKSAGNGLVEGATALVESVRNKLAHNEQTTAPTEQVVLLTPENVPVIPAEPPRPTPTPAREITEEQGETF